MIIDILMVAFIVIHSGERLYKYYKAKDRALGNNPHPCADHERRLNKIETKIDMIKSDILDIKLKFTVGGD
jgi:hypothetical protein